MKYRILGLLTGLLLTACGSGDTETLIVEGSVAGLKKGTLFLQQVQDTVLATLDSVQLKGTGEFRMESPIDGPDVYFLYLDKADNNKNNDRLIFFAEPGTIRIDTRWNAFEGEARISGSALQEKFAEYRRVQSRYSIQQLELAQASGALQAESDSVGLDSLSRLSDRLVLRSYLYALNFALNNSDSYLAPYVAISEVSDANPKYLDSIYRALTPEVAGSKYGRQLKALLENGAAE